MITVEAYMKPTKYKLNTKILNEAKLVGVDDVLNQLIWNLYLLKEQIYNNHNNIIYQDNQNSTKLDKKRRQSIRKRTKKIIIRYYFITDRITKPETYVALWPS